MVWPRRALPPIRASFSTSAYRSPVNDLLRDQFGRFLEEEVLQAVRRVLLQEDDDAGFDDAPPVRTSKKPCQAQSFAASCHQVTSPAASPHESMAELSFRV